MTSLLSSVFPRSLVACEEIPTTPPGDEQRRGEDKSIRLSIRRQAEEVGVLRFESEEEFLLADP